MKFSEIKRLVKKEVTPNAEFYDEDEHAYYFEGTVNGKSSDIKLVKDEWETKDDVKFAYKPDGTEDWIWM